MWKNLESLTAVVQEGVKEFGQAALTEVAKHAGVDVHTHNLRRGSSSG